MDYVKDPGWQFLRQPMEEQLKEQAAIKLDSKTTFWIPDADEGFILAQIKSEEDGKVTVSTANGDKVVKKDETQEVNPPKFEKAEDMSHLTFLNEASVLHNLRTRYSAMMIYTYSGLFCVVINPYKRLPIYTESVVKTFKGKRRNEMPPHLFAVADEAYRNMISDRENQSMLITGESGAGKTENTKKVIAYFAVVGASPSKKTDEKKIGLEEQIVQTNPVLEAFGNAKTVRNNNSSRFGKFIRIHFNHNGKLAGADIEHYLLEKSRVIKQAKGERSYHIFYQIMSGHIKGLKESLGLSDDIREYKLVSQAEVTIPETDDGDEMRITDTLGIDRDIFTFSFVSQAEVTIDNVNDAEEMQLTDEAFDVMNFSQNEKDDLYKLTAAIMHLGEMKFKQKPREEQAEPEETANAELACKLFGTNADNLLAAICKPRVKVGTEWVNKGQNLEQVNWSVGALAKALYARMFTWLIKRCNKTLDAHDLNRDYFTGVLDIAGFEIFDVNSFEQLWINFVNEKLQQFFNHHMFVLEQEEYQREGIQWEFIDFGLDLQACIELIEKPLGVISMLDEECIVPKASDTTFAQKLNDQHLGKHPNFQKPRPPKGTQGEAHFALVHYAGVVRYNAKQWLEKNKDPLNDTAVSVLKGTEDNQLLRDIWEDYRTQEDDAKDAEMGRAKQAPGKKKGKSGSMQTVSLLYRESLNHLMSMLKTTHPHFIRCIIPNEQKKSGLIEAGLVLNQLTCNGVLEGIRICRKGFPNRQLYDEFKHRYAILAAEEASLKDNKEAGEKMMQKLVKEGKIAQEEYRTGQTKIFFKAGILAKMEELRDETLSAIISKFQCACKSYLALCDYKRRFEQIKAYSLIQNNIRSWCTLRTWPWFSTYARVKPLIKGSKKSDEFEALEKKLVELEATLTAESQAKLATQQKLKNTEAEKNTLADQLNNEAAAKKALETKLNDVKGTVIDLEEANSSLNSAKKKLTGETQRLQSTVSDLEISAKKLVSEKEAKERTVISLQDEMTQQDALIARLNQDKKMQEEVNRQMSDNLLAESNRNERLEGIRNKLEGTIDEIEQTLQLEKKAKMDGDRLRKKLESELRMALEQLQEIKSQKADLENYLKKKDSELSAMKAQANEDQELASKFQITIRELQARIEQLEQELEQEIRGRRRAEKLKQDLQEESDLIAQRLEEANGSLSAQIHLNKQRKAELSRVYHEMEVKSMDHETHVNEMTNLHWGTLRHLQDLAQKAATLESEADNILHQVQNPSPRRLPISRSQIMEPAFDSRPGHQLIDSETEDGNTEDDIDRPIRGIPSRLSTRSLASNRSWAGGSLKSQSQSRITYTPRSRFLASDDEDEDPLPIIRPSRMLMPSHSTVVSSFVSKTPVGPTLPKAPVGPTLASRAGLTDSSGFDFEKRCQMIALSLESGMNIDIGKKKRKPEIDLPAPIDLDSEDDY